MKCIRRGRPANGRIFKDAGILSYWYLTVPTNSAHPNAAALLAGLLLSKEGQEILWKTEKTSSHFVEGTYMNKLVKDQERQGVKILRQSCLRGRKKSGEPEPSAPEVSRYPDGEIDVKGRWLLVGVSAAALLPVIGLLLVIFWMGFWQSGPGEPVVYTLNHYRNILTDSFTFKTLLNTLGFASTTVVVSLFFAVPIAWLVERTDLPGKELVFTLMAVGALVPTFFTAMGWVFLLHPRIGVVNRIFVDSFGLAQGPFNIASIIGMGWVEGLGLSSIAFIMIVATYRTMDPSLEDAGRIHGLNIVKTLRYITLPLTFPGILAAAIYIFTIGLSAFEVPAIIGMSNKIFTFSTFIFYKMQPLEELPNYGVAGAVSSLLVVLALLLSWWYFRVLRFSSRYAVVAGARLSPKAGGAWAARTTLRLDLSWLVFSSSETIAVFSPRLGRAAEFFSTAVLGGTKPGVSA